MAVGIPDCLEQAVADALITVAAILLSQADNLYHHIPPNGLYQNLPNDAWPFGRKKDVLQFCKNRSLEEFVRILGLNGRGNVVNGDGCAIE
jgi:hypothetical protein